MEKAQDRQVFKVALSRFASGQWSEEKDRYEDRGDIAEATCCDTIAMEGRVRDPIRFGGHLVCITGGSYGPRGEEATGYKLLDPRQFPRTVTSYYEKIAIEGGDAARRDPFGFYDGMKVKHGGREYVLTGPAMTFQGDKALDIPKPVQGSLF